MNKKESIIQVTVNGKIYKTVGKESILRFMKSIGIAIPSPCSDPGSHGKIKCKLCLVEIDGEERLYRSCAREITDGMTIITESPEIEVARKSNLKLLFDKHYKKEMCDACIWDGDCILHDLARKYNLKY